MIVLSLGAGVQSSVVLLMSARGELPKVDHAVFADTGWEPKAVYGHLKWLTKEAAKYGISVHQVTAGNIRQDALSKQVKFTSNGSDERQRFASMPLHVLGGNGDAGMVRRQCTREYKIEPITRFIKQDLLGYAKGQRMPKGVLVDQWFGISSDEAAFRIRDSHSRWIRNVYPLANFPDMGLRAMSRSSCLVWFEKNYPGRSLTKSACIGCPYRSNASWRDMRADPETWKDAVDFDKRIRRMEGFRGTTFLHRDLVPLDEANIDEDPNQHTFEFVEDCEGMCGV